VRALFVGAILYECNKRLPQHDVLAGRSQLRQAQISERGASTTGKPRLIHDEFRLNDSHRRWTKKRASIRNAGAILA